MSLQCPHCGESNLRDQARFCDNCGHALSPMLTVPLDEDGATTALSAAEITEDDGATIAMPEAKITEDDGATMAMPDAKITEDDGSTIAMPPEDDGATKAMPESEKPEVASGKGTVVIADLKVGQVLQKRYQLDKMLGAGGFGAVYLAQDVKLKRACVVKQMLIPRTASLEDIELYQTNFEREADLLVQLNHPGHPNIPEIYDYFSDASGNYLVMKYIEGRSLKDILEQGEGKIPWREAVRYAVDVCDALNYMHTLAGEPVMHRDIKPANVLLGDDGRVWLVDFGLAKANPVEGADELGVTQAAGSIGYTPFEQWLGEATPPSDIYALGATLHHLVTGLNPVAAFADEIHIQKLQEMHGQFTPLRKIDRGLPKELEGIVKQATAAEPGQRPTALQLKQQLEAMISGRQDVGLFTFKSGESAKTTGELVELCEKYRSEAEGYLYRGDFERWFIIINRNDLAEAAVQAAKRGKNQKDGLEKFLKLIMPNLFLRRLGKASWHLTRVAVQVLLIFVIFVLFVAIGGSYLTRWFIQQSIGGYAWNYSALNLDRENRFSEQFLTEKFKAATQSYLNDIQVEVHAPNRLDIWANWAGIPLNLPLTLQLEDKKPHFYLTEINDTPLFVITDNLSAGVNRGIDHAFQKGPVDVSSLEVQDGAVVFSVEPSGRTPLVTPTPVLTAGPTPTPTPVNLTLVAVFNDLEQDIILEIDGETWHILANDTKVIEKEPGTYNYTARYSTTDQLAARGTISWARKVYRWHLGLGDVEE